MSSWHFELWLIPYEQAPPTLDAEFRAPTLHRDNVAIAKPYLSASPLRLRTPASRWTIAGDSDHSLVELFEDGSTVEVWARIDVRLDADRSCDLVCGLAALLGCRLYLAEAGEVIEPSPNTLRLALMASSAWAFSIDPERFLDGEI